MVWRFFLHKGLRRSRLENRLAIALWLTLLLVLAVSLFAGIRGLTLC